MYLVESLIWGGETRERGDGVMLDLDFWHCRQAGAHLCTSMLIPGYTCMASDHVDPMQVTCGFL